MANVGNQLASFLGAWDETTQYFVGDCVLGSDTALYQANADSLAQDPTVGPPWIDCTAIALALAGAADPTAGDGVPCAIGSTYVEADTGFLVKTGSGATAWTIIVAPA